MGKDFLTRVHSYEIHLVFLGTGIPVSHKDPSDSFSLTTLVESCLTSAGQRTPWGGNLPRLDSGKSTGWHGFLLS